MSKKIKNKQKKFLGETLNQYDKALDEAINQLDKKNREQNHKISSLVNSFDNEYLEKDVEGNMTTLENSKDGMVIINEIQGNTEVNYCKDGEKELILNGDIDTQGESFVTITEGVDGGLVDVSLEGNTEINLSNTKDPVLVTREFDDINCNTGKLQYTIDDVTTINDEPGKVDIDRIVGDTMVNHAVNGSEELILNAHINESGDNNITLNGVTSDGGKVDVVLEGNTLVNVSKTKDTTPITRKGEDAIGNHIALADEGSIRPVLNGNTLVNVCDQKDPIAITKSYTVETGNHVALQGEYDGKCRPVVTGNTLVNIIDSFGSVINAEADFSTGSYKCTANGTARHLYYKVIPKTSTTYTAIAYVNKNTINDKFSLIGLDVTENNSPITIPTGFTGLFVSKFTTKADNLDNIWETDLWKENTEGEIEIKGFMILEGDYTNKPIPEYFTGLQSSFEDKVVTQEMVDTGEELAENLGKYKIEYKVVGKNKVSKISKTTTWTNATINIVDGAVTFVPASDGTIGIETSVYIPYKAKIGTTLTFSRNYVSGATTYTSGSLNYFPILVYEDGTQENMKPRDVFTSNITSTKTITKTLAKNIVGYKMYAIAYAIRGLTSSITYNAQLEEGSVATSYEPYKEYKKTFYLNSPLLEGDTIEQQGDNVVHVHRYNKVVLDGNDDETWVTQPLADSDTTLGFRNQANINSKEQANALSDRFVNMYSWDKVEHMHFNRNALNITISKSKLQTQDVAGLRQWLQANPTTVVYELATPTYEVISQNDTILCDSYVNGHLDVNSVVPIEKVAFKDINIYNRYLYPNIEYIVQFESDNIGITDIYLGGNRINNNPIVKGINKFTITTPNELANYILLFKGIGFNASNIVVTPAIEQDFDYFSGMQSCFEDNLVTEGENAGKYEVTYKVTGKNKLNLPQTYTREMKFTDRNVGYRIAYYKLEPNKDYILTGNYSKSIEELGHGGIDISLFEDIPLDIDTWYLSQPNEKRLFWSEYYSVNLNYKFNSEGYKYVGVYIGIATGIAHNHVATVSNLQLEEGSVATPYEPYKEYTKTLYLNSPLLEGDTIEEKDGNIYHVHRYNKVVLDGSDDEGWLGNGGSETKRYWSPNCLDSNASYNADLPGSDEVITNNLPWIGGWSDTAPFGISRTGDTLFIYNNAMSTEQAFKQWLQSNPVTAIYQLATPQYEVIQQGTIAIPTYSAGHLDVTSAVPVDKVNFLHFEEELTYLYPSTSYTVQFTSDNAITADITLGGTQLLAQDIVQGLNRISITTPSELVDNKLVINGVGAKISNIVVTDTDREFKYFEGMKSVGECEELEVTANNKNLWNWDDMYNQYGTTNPNVYKKFNGTLTKINDNEYSITPYQGNWYEQGIFSTPVHLKKGESLTFSGESSHFSNICIYNLFNFLVPCSSVVNNSAENSNDFMPFTINCTAQEDGYYVCRFWIWNNQTAICRNIQVEKSSQATDYIPRQSNVQQLTHEPLRGIGEVRDRYVMVDGKWYIERNCAEVVLDGSESGWNFNTKEAWNKTIINTPKNSKLMCYNLKPAMSYDINSESEYYVKIHQYIDNELDIKLYNGNTLNDILTWLSKNPTSVIYPLTQPYYEEINYNPLEVYSDVTHITTNSAVPTNITIKNHGYNLVALKENTQYTLYVNKDTTNTLTYRLGDYIEINSPSKFTFTTPETLTDKTLRIDSKGAKVKDLMLIEGTPANDPVGYFDGLKSSYECEKVTDESDENYGKYKVETIVRGKNLFDVNKITSNDSVEFTSNGFILTKTSKWGGIGLTHFKVKKYTDYIFKFKVLVTSGKANFTIRDNILNTELKGVTTILPSSEWIEKTIKWNSQKRDRITLYFYSNFSNSAIDEANVEFKDIQIEEGIEATEYEPYFESKQTVYLNSPLLKGDEIVWKDNKIQHYHKMNKVVLDGSDDENWKRDNLTNNYTDGSFIATLNTTNMKDKTQITTGGIVDKLPNASMNREIYSSTILQKSCYSSGWRQHFICLKNTSTLEEVLVYLQQNPIKVAYELETPYYEEISDYPLKLNVIANSSLSTESTIQVTNISFNIYEETLPYLYPNTKYYITFNADVDRNNIIIDLGGNHVVFDCKVGFNKVEITTPSDTTNLLTFSGTGVNIDHVKVTKQDIDEYFEGMKSVGECENNTLEIVCKNNDNSKSNTQTLTHEPLRAVEDIKDRYVLIDGKWYIERNCREMIITSEDISGIGLMEQDLNNGYERYSLSFHSMTNYRAKRQYQKLLNNSFYSQVGWKFEGECMFLNEDNSIGLILNKNRNIGNNYNKLREFLTNNPVKFIYELASPIYEEINYNPFEVYSDVTHISTNSLIPANVVIKNHGYNCILKPSTKYTVALNKPNGTISAKLGGSAKVDSTNSVFTITTPSTLNDNVLRLSGSGNVKDIMILEGDKTVNTPSYFEGIESVFEQEYDAEKGKYRVTVKVEGNGKESSIIFYINEPLRGTDTAKDKVFIQDGKVVVERNCGSVTLDGSADEGWSLYENKSCKDSTCIALRNPNEVKTDNFGFSTLLCDKLQYIKSGYSNDSTNISTYVNDKYDNNHTYIRIKNAQLRSSDKQGVIQWLQQNPVTVVYQLSEPVYEEAECDLSKLVLENYENSSLIFKSNIPVSANVRYSGEVPVVTQAKSLSSQVDNTTLDINENIIPYMCDIDYRIVELQLMNGDTQGEDIELLGIGDIEILGNENVLFNNREDKKYNYSYDMLKRDILSQRYSKEEYQYRLDRYLLANKISDEEYKELEGLLNNGE